MLPQTLDSARLVPSHNTWTWTMAPGSVRTGTIREARLGSMGPWVHGSSMDWDRIVRTGTSMDWSWLVCNGAVVGCREQSCRDYDRLVRYRAASIRHSILTLNLLMTLTQILTKHPTLTVTLTLLLTLFLMLTLTQS